jgi:hypothetical protein
MSNTHWLVITSRDWEDDLLADYWGDENWLCPIFEANRDEIAPGDGVIIAHGRTRLAWLAGTVTSTPYLIEGEVVWGNGRVLVDRLWWDWHVDLNAEGGVPLTATEDEYVRHPSLDYGGQRGWMAPVPPGVFQRIARRIGRAGGDVNSDLVARLREAVAR